VNEGDSPFQKKGRGRGGISKGGINGNSIWKGGRGTTLQAKREGGWIPSITPVQKDDRLLSEKNQKSNKEGRYWERKSFASDRIFRRGMRTRHS